MIWVLILRPRAWVAVIRNVCNDIDSWVFGPTCHVTGDRVDPKDRVNHEHHQHPTDGPCVLI